MGCAEIRNNPPILSFIFEPQNDTQKDYCNKLKDELKPRKSIKYEIKSFIGADFKIILKINGKTNIIEDSFNENNKKKSIKYIKQLLDEAFEGK